MSAILGKWLGELTDPGVSMAGKYLFVCVCEDLPSVCILGGYVIVVFDIQRCLWRTQPRSSQPFP